MAKLVQDNYNKYMHSDIIISIRTNISSPRDILSKILTTHLLHTINADNLQYYANLYRHMKTISN